MPATHGKCIYGGLTLDVDRHYIECVTATSHQEKGMITIESKPPPPPRLCLCYLGVGNRIPSYSCIFSRINRYFTQVFKYLSWMLVRYFVKCICSLLLSQSRLEHCLTLLYPRASSWCCSAADVGTSYELLPLNVVGVSSRYVYYLRL